MTAFQIKVELESVDLLESYCIVDGNPSKTLVIFAHGAGANMHHDFMVKMAHAMASDDIGVVRFNFPYMRANAIDGKRRPPDRTPKLIKDFVIHIQTIMAEYAPERVVLMGKSMGGRMAAIVAADVPVAGVICLGYPFVALKGGEPRLAPLEECLAPIFIIQGERDKFGHKGQVDQWSVVDKTKLLWLTDGDHSFVPRKSSGVTLEDNLAIAISHSIEFIQGLDG